MLSWSSAYGWQFSWLAAIAVAIALGFAIRKSRRKRRRRASLRREDGGGYVWIDLDGSSVRSDTDPRDRWNREDADEWGDGDGGD